MPDVFDGTNPITDILGDDPTERELTFENQSVQNFIEPLTLALLHQSDGLMKYCQV